MDAVGCVLALMFGVALLGAAAVVAIGIVGKW